MADLTKLQSDRDALVAAVDAAVAEIKDLKAKLAASEADQAGVDEVAASLEAKTAELTAAAQP